MTAKKVPSKPSKPDVPANAETDIEGSASLALLIALLHGAGITVTAQQAAALSATMQSSAAIAATDTQHKTDVNVPELMTSLNGLVLSNAVTHAKNVDAITLQTISANQQHNVTLRQMEGDHRDQNHTQQLTLDEQALAVIAAYGRALSTSINPIPPKDDE